MAHRSSLLAACAALVLAAPLAAARPALAPPPPIVTTAADAGVTVHRGHPANRSGAEPRFAGGAPWFAGDARGPGYWEANYGREDDAAIFARRYGCARPIWNAKSNRYMPACN